MARNQQRHQPVNRVSEYAQEGREMLGEYPVSSVVIAFGLGLATGLAVTALFSEDEERHRYRHMSHRLGQQLLDAMQQMVPESVARNFRA
ncbi:MAG: hypothetical protein AB7F89_22550 [Pirellulaceae bacterium]